MKQTYLLFLLISTLSYAQLTPPSSQQTYYTDVDFSTTGMTLFNDLATETIAKHTNFLSYSEIWDSSKITDEDPDSSSNVILIYGYDDSDGDNETDRSRSKTLNGGTNGTDWNREHTFPNSLANPKLEDDTFSYADAHNLRPADVDMNGSRGNLKFAAGSGNAGSVSGGWYPGDEWKGDAARIIMYMYLKLGSRCYPSFATDGTTNSVDSNMIDLLLEWNAADPVSDIEDNRNTYHGNTSNTYAQGNRNPFIDNPYLATVIWGGTAAENRWNTTPDTEDPTTPMALAASNPTETTVDLSWTASTDNIAVSSYDVYIGGLFYVNTTSNASTYTVTGLTASTAYTFTILAKDAAGNTSSLSSSATETTAAPDTQDPTTPTNLMASNPTASTVDLSWTASTDNTAVTSYDVYVDSGFYVNTESNATTYTVTGLTASTPYTFTLLAKDASGNTSSQSASATETTLAPSAASGDLFFSEYMEGSGNNKAIEIANFSGSDITDLSIYQVKLSANGAADWTTYTYSFPSGASITDNDVYVIGNGSLAVCTGVVDDSNSSITGFNGNDAIGLFKNGLLIDIIGTLGSSTTFASNTTLVRNNTITGGNTTYDSNEWTSSASDTCTNLGQHSQATLDITDINTNFDTIKLYPNPLNGDQLFIKTNETLHVKIFSFLGQQIINTNVDSSHNYINISNLNKGVYLVNISNGNKSVIKKLIKQ